MISYIFIYLVFGIYQFDPTMITMLMCMMILNEILILLAALE